MQFSVLKVSKSCSKLFHVIHVSCMPPVSSFLYQVLFKHPQDNLVIVTVDIAVTTVFKTSNYLWLKYGYLGKYLLFFQVSLVFLTIATSPQYFCCFKTCLFVTIWKCDSELFLQGFTHFCPVSNICLISQNQLRVCGQAVARPNLVGKL